MSMLWQRFTERAKRIVIAAQEEAARRGEPHVNPEHLLLGLVKNDDSVASKVLERVGVPASRVQRDLEAQLGGPGQGRRNSNDVTLDPRMKRVLDFAYDEARQTNTNYIGTEHFLLGILREGKGVAFQTLSSLEVDLESARRETVAYLGGERAAASPAMRKRERHWEIRKFEDPAEATAWVNSMLKTGYEVSHASTTQGCIWLIAQGWAEVDGEEVREGGKDGEGGQDG